jgi:hypothetical protein
MLLLIMIEDTLTDLDDYVQADPPPEAQRDNWLPARRVPASRCSCAPIGRHCRHRRLVEVPVRFCHKCEVRTGSEIVLVG